MANMKSIAPGSDYRTSLPLRGRRPVTQDSSELLIAVMLWTGASHIVTMSGRNEEALAYFNSLRARHARGQITHTEREQTMHTEKERRFAALIYLPKFIEAWASNVEPRHQDWTKEERHEAFRAIKSMLGTYIDVNNCSNEDIADAFREVVLKLLDGRARVELVP